MNNINTTRQADVQGIIVNNQLVEQPLTGTRVRVFVDAVESNRINNLKIGRQVKVVQPGGFRPRIKFRGKLVERYQALYENWIVVDTSDKTE